MTPDVDAVTRPFALIGGGGPVGMVIALELARRGVSSVLLNEHPGPSEWPKANATSPRSMEHLRRLGVAERFRRMALPADYPCDVTYFTRFSGHELGRLHMPGWGEAVEQTRRGEGPWPGPEPANRGSQLFLERALYDRLADFPEIAVRFGWRLEGFTDLGDGVEARAVDLATGEEHTLEADYLVGCDGGGSRVRKALDIELEGDAGVVRPFFGGSMVSAFVRQAPAPGMHWPDQSWQYWIVTPDIRALCCAIDGGDRYVWQIQLPQERPLDETYVRDMLERAIGGPALREVISFVPWTAGYRLLAQHYGRGRVWLAGDAVHLFTPTGGLGMNTGIDDAVNLAWKLAAVARGWAGPHLLDSYETDRRAIGGRNLDWSKRFADSVGGTTVSAGFEAATDAAARERDEVGAKLVEHARYEFLIPGIHLGFRYEGSPLVWADGTPEPPDTAGTYEQTARPGHRAPHVWLDGDTALFDRLGVDFTLLKLGGTTARVEAIRDGFAARGVPLAVLELDDPAVRDIYGKDLALIGPDQIVCWRGDAAPSDPVALADRVRGCRAA